MEKRLTISVRVGPFDPERFTYSDAISLNREVQRLCAERTGGEALASWEPRAALFGFEEDLAPDMKETR